MWSRSPWVTVRPRSLLSLAPEPLDPVAKGAENRVRRRKRVSRPASADAAVLDGGRDSVSATTHHGVVTLVHGNSLYLWDLDEDSPFHLSVGRASDGSRPYVGAVVR